MFLVHKPVPSGAFPARFSNILKNNGGKDKRFSVKTKGKNFFFLPPCPISPYRTDMYGTETPRKCRSPLHFRDIYALILQTGPTQPCPVPASPATPTTHFTVIFFAFPTNFPYFCIRALIRRKETSRTTLNFTNPFGKPKRNTSRKRQAVSTPREKT